jgi:hypothetical protein
MLTGRRAFPAATATETLAVILERDIDWTKLPSSTPSHVRAVLRRTLNKDPRRRLHDIADARIELEDASPTEGALPNATRPRGLRTTLSWASAAIVAIAAFALAEWWYLGGASPTAPVPAGVTRLLVAPEAPLAADSEGMVALSPDGRRLAYVATADGRQQIYLRDLTQFEGKALAGTENGYSPEDLGESFRRRGNVVTVVGLPPAAETRQIPVARPGLNRIASFDSQLRPRPSANSKSVIGRPSHRHITGTRIT